MANEPMEIKELVEKGFISKEEAMDWFLWKMQNLGGSGIAMGEFDPVPFQEAYTG